MKKTMIRNSMVAALTVCSFAVATPMSAAALPAARAAEAQAADQEQSTAATENKEAARERLAGAKLKACQNRERNIVNIMTRIADRGQKQVDLFSKIADRTEAFYTNKGKTLSNYGALVAAVASTKASAQAAVQATKTAASAFTCDGTDPKGTAAAFKESLQTQHEALQAYKTAVKHLIVGVKSVQGSATSSTQRATGGEQ